MLVQNHLDFNLLILQNVSHKRLLRPRPDELPPLS